MLHERDPALKKKLIVGILVVSALFLVNVKTPAMSHDGGRTTKLSLAELPQGTNVTGEGCVRAGVEAGCLNLTTADKKDKFSLHFDIKNKPSADSMIHFEGTMMDVDTCMQGTPVKVTKWTALKTKCPAESK